MALPFYCNITTDLRDAYTQIEEYASTRFRIKDFEVYSAGGSIYRSYNPGDIEQCYEDGIRLTGVSAIVSINAASRYYYDSTNDILYIRSSDDADPDTHEIEKGFDWETLKTRARNDASDEIDGLLDNRFPRPIPQSRSYHSTRKYDFALVKATALLTCANILNAYGEFETANELRKQVTDIENENGIIDKYNDKRLRFSWETTPGELGRFNIETDSSNSNAGFIELNGRYGGSSDIDDPLIDFDLEDETWLFEIDGAGATGTATFKWSRDNGSNWQATTKATNYEWVSLSAGIYIRFWDRNGEFTVGDKWRAYMHVERREDIVKPPTLVFRG